uniref:Uncharacterized protein n=1 Tax=Ananas comosus var. bracteatus TaxID=296719 RepID=A0A6V7P909_ANACO|nr:unnamed protein product [Ananas comosus var. bracteatus]
MAPSASSFDDDVISVRSLVFDCGGLSTALESVGTSPTIKVYRYTALGRAWVALGLAPVPEHRIATRLGSLDSRLREESTKPLLANLDEVWSLLDFETRAFLVNPAGGVAAEGVPCCQGLASEVGYIGFTPKFLLVDIPDWIGSDLTFPTVEPQVPAAAPSADLDRGKGVAS